MKRKKHPQRKKVQAFTLAEVLITLGIIGIVAAMTLPTFNHNILKKKYTTFSQKENATLIQALKLMEADDILLGHETTEDFVNALKTKLRITKVCSNSELDKCFPKEFTAGNQKLKPEDMKKSEALGHKDWGSDVIGIQTGDGIYMLTAYAPNCSDEDYKNCAAFVYDMNANAGPNNYTGVNGESDMAAFNASFKKVSECGEKAVVNEWNEVYMDGPSGKTDECYKNNWDTLNEACNKKAGNDDFYIFKRKSPHDGHAVYFCMCLAKGSMIALADGSSKKIEEISYDDELLVWDFDNGRISKSKAAWIMQPAKTDRYNLLTFSDGTQLKTINQHRIFNKEAGKYTYPMTDETPIGTTTLKNDGSEVKLVDKKVVEEPVEYYNLITSNHFNCFANGISTSNRFNNLYPIKDYKFVKDDRELVPYEKYEDIVSREMYEQLRLSEQTCDEEIKKYLINLKENMQVKRILTGICNS